MLAREAWLERVDRALATGHPIGILLLDIDELAQANEAWGYSAGGGNHAIYDAGHIRDQRRRNELMSRLRQAVERQEFRLAYQPIVGADGRTIGAEALLRWNVPGEILPPPCETIGLLEESGMI